MRELYQQSFRFLALSFARVPPNEHVGGGFVLTDVKELGTNAKPIQEVAQKEEVDLETQECDLAGRRHHHGVGSAGEHQLGSAGRVEVTDDSFATLTELGQPGAQHIGISQAQLETSDTQDYPFDSPRTGDLLEESVEILIGARFSPPPQSPLRREPEPSLQLDVDEPSSAPAKKNKGPEEYPFDQSPGEKEEVDDGSADHVTRTNAGGA